MVLPLGPGKFYGSSLPRPRIYTDVKFNDERVDPPVAVFESLLSWANEAHWSMGGLSFKRLRLQGKIEGNVQKLRKEQEKILKKNPQISTPVVKSKGKPSSFVGKPSRKSLDSPPGAPMSRKLTLRSRVIGADGNEEEIGLKEVQKGVEIRKRRRLVRKLGEDFDKVAENKGNSKSVERVAARSKNRTRRCMVLMEDEEEDGDDIGLSKVKNAAVCNGEMGAGEDVSKKNGEKASVYPAGTRSSPR